MRGRRRVNPAPWKTRAIGIGVLACRSLAVALLATLPCMPPALADTPGAQSLLEQQRRVFRQVYARAELGDWRPALQNAALLRPYALWPDLRAAWLRTRIRNNDFADVDTFLVQYGTLKPARDLRFQYALALGHNGNFAAYLDLYQHFYQEPGLAELDCLALQAQLATGSESLVSKPGIEKWMTGRNQVWECDPVFDYLRNSGVLGVEQYRQRFELAIEARQFNIARYLADSLSSDYKKRARQWSRVVDHPEQFLRHHDTSKNSVEYREQLLFAAEQLAYKQPLLSATLWRDAVKLYPFDSVQSAGFSRHVALWAARRQVTGALEMLNAVPDEAIDVEVYRWIVRANLRQRNWHGVLAAINDMPEEEQQAEVWRFWLARASQEIGNKVLADVIFERLAQERSFYGFLAADQTGKEYRFADSRLVSDDVLIKELEQRKSLLRARELFLVGLEGRGRSEWDAVFEKLSLAQKLQASILAHRWGWHSRAIVTSATLSQYNDLELRYPLPYPQIFEKYASASNIQHSWLLGVARSESLFMRDIRSSAGAIGLMQLLPETARRTAREFSLPYAGRVTLTDPAGNIQLGTSYLRKLLERFDNNRVLATAAYNTGPLNVAAWLPEQGAVDALIWIENIPYNETRKYVRRVFTTNIIFHWRLTGETTRLSRQFTMINAAVNPQ